MSENKDFFKIIRGEDAKTFIWSIYHDNMPSENPCLDGSEPIIANNTICVYGFTGVEDDCCSMDFVYNGGSSEADKDDLETFCGLMDKSDGIDVEVCFHDNFSGVMTISALAEDGYKEEEE